MRTRIIVPYDFHILSLDLIFYFKEKQRWMSRDSVAVTEMTSINIDNCVSNQRSLISTQGYFLMDSKLTV